MEKLNFGEQKNKEEELINFFEQKGFTNLKRASHDGGSFVFIGEKNGEKCFIKKLNHPKTSDNKDINHVRTKIEIDCYKNLPPEIRIPFVEGSDDEQECYLALQYVDLKDIERVPQELEKMMDLSLKEYNKVDASFLPETDWHLYEMIFERAEELEKLGIIDNAETIKKLFMSHKDLIENFQKGFSHLDFNFLNVKRLNDRVVSFDFENARQDNAMVDMGVLYIEISDDAKLVQSFKSRIEKSDLYNEQLLKLMTIRRCIIFLYACRGMNTPIVQKNKDVLRDMLNKDGMWD